MALFVDLDEEDVEPPLEARAQDASTLPKPASQDATAASNQPGDDVDPPSPETEDAKPTARNAVTEAFTCYP